MVDLSGSRPRTRLAVLIVAVLAAFLVHALVVALPYVSIGRNGWFSFPVTDDAYYYFQPAWNLVHGSGLTMDSRSPTNGFHPLWMAVAVLLAAASSAKPVFLSNLVLVAVLVFYLSAAVQGLVVRSVFGSRFLAFVAVILYLVLPQVFSQHLNGLETGLVLLCSLLSLQVLLRLLRAPDTGSPVGTALLGVATALLFLARTDMVFCVLAMSALCFQRFRRAAGGSARRSSMSLSRHGIGFIAPHIFLVGPWLGWNLARFGSIVQGSAWVFPVLARRHYSVYYDCPGAGWHQLVPPGVWYAFADIIERSTVGVPVGVFIGLVLLSFLAVSRAGRRRVTGAYFSVAGVLTASFCALTAVHVAVRISPRPWYFPHAQLLMILAVVGILHALQALVGSRGLTVSAALLCVGALGCRNGDLLLGLVQPRSASEAELDARVEALYARVPEEATIVGHTDSGRFTFFAPERLTVVNLDGLSNNTAGKALRRGTLMDYIVTTPVQYVILRPNIGNIEAVMGRGYRRFLKLNGPVGGTYGAHVVRGNASIRRHLTLPDDGTVCPGRADHWQYLLGEWRFVPGVHRESRVGVQDCGVQFSIEQEGRHDFEVVLASPYVGVTLACDVVIDGYRVGEIAYSSPEPRAFALSAGDLESGVHEILLANRQRVSARMLGMNDDGAVKSYVIYSFRLTPAAGRSSGCSSAAHRVVGHEQTAARGQEPFSYGATARHGDLTVELRPYTTQPRARRLLERLLASFLRLR